MKIFKSSYLSAAFVLSCIFSTTAFCDIGEKDVSFYDLKIVKSTSDAKQVVTITVTGKSGFKCNIAYPWKLKMKPSPGLSLEKDVYKKTDAEKFDKDAVVFKVSYGVKPKQKVSADLKLSMCDDKICKMKTIPLTW